MVDFGLVEGKKNLLIRTKFRSDKATEAKNQLFELILLIFGPFLLIFGPVEDKKSTFLS